VDLVSNPGLRAELAAARAWGVSWRRFSGWEPATTTTFEYDDAGRLAKSVTTVEPEWDGAERDTALALAAYEADLCPGCHRPMSETTARENQKAYVAGAPIRCHCCTASQRAAEDYEKSPQPQALFIPVELRGDG
jgi:hypothetical protein